MTAEEDLEDSGFESEEEDEEEDLSSDSQVGGQIRCPHHPASRRECRKTSSNSSRSAAVAKSRHLPAVCRLLLAWSTLAFTTQQDTRCRQQPGHARMTAHGTPATFLSGEPTGPTPPFLFATQQAHDESQDSEDIDDMDLSDTDEDDADPGDMGELQEDTSGFTQSMDSWDEEVETYTELHTAAGECRTHVWEQSHLAPNLPLRNGLRHTPWQHCM